MNEQETIVNKTYREINILEDSILEHRTLLTKAKLYFNLPDKELTIEDKIRIIIYTERTKMYKEIIRRLKNEITKAQEIIANNSNETEI